MAPENSCLRGVDGKAMMITDGPGFPAIYTSGNSPITSNKCWVNKLQLGNCQVDKSITMHVQVMVSTMKFIWALQQDT